ncbi:hypothetical protein MPSEU_000924100 [Mayamaea pseudoterrestris]|nr:hypothetical protein MPSEU_000924100 [Mayamaea pseudoterrestris]
MYSDFATSVGGYSEAPLNDRNHPRLQQAAEFAVTEAIATQQYSFMTSLSSSSSGGSNGVAVPFVICKAFQQVVAGMNLRMVIMIQDDNKNCLGAFATTVYDRFGDLSVTDWSPEPVSCEIAQQMLAGEYVGSGALESFFN